VGIRSRSGPSRVVTVDGVNWERGVREGSSINLGDFWEGFDSC
jgi:hypothetical protein